MRGRLERVKGGWRIVVEEGKDPSTGKRRRIIRSLVGRTRPQAEEEFADFMKRLSAGARPGADRVPLAEYLRDWFAAHSPNLAPSTRISYKMILDNHLIPALGMIPLAKLQPLQIQGYYAEELQRLSPRTVRYHHTVLRKALAQAVKWRILGINPADAVNAPRPKRPMARALDVEGVKKLLSVAEGHPDYPLIHTAIFTGLRRGELAALRWSNVDLAGMQIAVAESMIRLKGEYVFREPKTKKGRRRIPLTKDAACLLRSLRKHYLTTKIRLGPDFRDHDLVFSRADGEPLDPGEVSHRFSALAEQAGFEGLRFHDLRHTYATMLLRAGVHPKVVQELLGHEHISTTLDTYTHLVPSLCTDATERLESLFSEDGTKMAPKNETAACHGGDS